MTGRTGAPLRAAVVARIEADKPGGELERQTDGRWRLTMTRVLPYPPGQVWPWLVDPDRLGRWSPIVPDRPLDRAGPATSREQPDGPASDVTVLRADEPHELVHRWHDHELRWTLTAVRDGTRLRLEHTFANRPDASSFGAGWHVCLAALGAVLRGADADRPVGERALDYGWADLRDAYDRSWS